MKTPGTIFGVPLSSRDDKLVLLAWLDFLIGGAGALRRGLPAVVSEVSDRPPIEVADDVDRGRVSR